MKTKWRYNSSGKQDSLAWSALMDAVEAGPIEAFLAVVQTGSFSAAGRKIGRDGSVVSRRVAALEARLGISLLERHRSLRLSRSVIGIGKSDWREI
jgi:hypothetical protein